MKVRWKTEHERMTGVLAEQKRRRSLGKVQLKGGGEPKSCSRFQWQDDSTSSQVESSISKVEGDAITVNHHLVFPSLLFTLLTTQILSENCSLRRPAIVERRW